MAMAYIRLYYSWPDQTRALSYEEKGRLVDSMMQYALGGAWEELLTGNEKYLFPVFQRQLDNAAAKYAQVCAREGARFKIQEFKNEDERREVGRTEDQEQQGILQKIDDNWRTSARARGAAAQLLVDQFICENTACSRAGNLHELVMEALDAGLEPQEILELGRSENPSELGFRIYELGEGMCS